VREVMNNYSHYEITLPIRDFLKRERDFHLLSFLILLFFLGVYLLSPSFQPFLSIIIPIFVAFYIAIFSTEYAIFRNRFVEINSAFKSLFNEIVKNRERIDDILIRIEDIKKAWIQLKKNIWINEKTIVKEKYSTKTGFIYQYLPNNALKVIQSYNLDQIIQGAENCDCRPNYYQQISLLYYYFVKTSEETQRIEDEINDFINLIESHHEPIDPTIIPKKVIDDSGILYFECKQFGYEINDFNSLFVNGQFDHNKWEKFVEEKVQNIINSFKNCRDKQNEECSDIVRIGNYSDFFNTIIVRDMLFPPDSISKIFGSINPWQYLLLVPAVIAIWATFLIVTGLFDIVYYLLSGFLISLIFIILFIILFGICFIIRCLFY